MTEVIPVERFFTVMRHEEPDMIPTQITMYNYPYEEDTNCKICK